MESSNAFIDISLGVQLWSKWNYVINLCSQPINSSILKNLCQAKHQKHINKKIFKNEFMEDMKWCVRYDASWRRINKDLATMNHTLKNSKRESWCQGTRCERSHASAMVSSVSCWKLEILFQRALVLPSGKTWWEIHWSTSLWLTQLLYWRRTIDTSFPIVSMGKYRDVPHPAARLEWWMYCKSLGNARDEH
jgi:hypothetical protein